MHFHTLCENEAQDLINTFNAFEQQFGMYLSDIKWINMGGGHHITRDGYDVEVLIDFLKRVKEKYRIEILLEPGEAIGWRTGYLLSEVQDVVTNGKIPTAMLDVSFSAHMPDCLEMPYQPQIRDAEKGESGVAQGPAMFR